MIIYNENRTSKLYYPQGSKTAIATEVRGFGVGKCKNWMFVEFYINGVRFCKIQCEMHDYSDTIKSFQTCADQIEAFARDATTSDDLVMIISKYGSYEVLGGK